MSNQYTKNSIKENRIGEQKYNNQGELMTIIDYNGAFDVTVLFEKTQKTKKCRYSNFKLGKVKDNFLPVVSNVGFIGDTVVKKEDHSKGGSYRVWVDMIERCYSKTRYKKYKSYDDCSVCNEWLCYANFKKWYNENYYNIEEETMCIDKDIIVKGNKIYSPDTCVFVPQRINKLFVNNKSNRGKYPIGVTYDMSTGYFVSIVRENNRNLKTYHKTPEDAFNSYKERKEEIIKKVADEYKDKIPQRLYDAMYAYKVEIID